MAPERLQTMSRRAWELARNQHGVIARPQLIALGFTDDAIRHRMSRGRLRAVWRGVYAVGRPELTHHGRWMAAVLTCGSNAVLSHETAAVLWGIRTSVPAFIAVSVPPRTFRRYRGIRIHRRPLPNEDVTRRERIPVTAPARTLIDLGVILPPGALEAAINEADKLGLIDPEALRAVAGRRGGCAGTRAIKAVLDRRTFALTDSELERRFLALVRRARMPEPLTQQRVNGFRVDFVWPELRLIVETDGLRYHRTPTQQSRDRVPDQAHAAAGFTALRFTHAQVRFEPEHVIATLRSIAERVQSTLFAAFPAP
jgi:very-short-patch-repair endonuclease